MQEMRELPEIQKAQQNQQNQRTLNSRGEPVVTVTDTITGETGWQSPEYEVVETALEVTAYALATR